MDNPALEAQLTQTKQNLTDAKAAVAPIVAGVKALDDMIVAFQNSPGTLSTTDQAMIDDIVAASADLRDTVKAVDTTPPGNPPANPPV